ncbi:hypothetical protein ACTG9Q_20875 [Actinokineospora sp. 24-640]
MFALEQQEELWQWAERAAASAPPWTDERWARTNAIIGRRLARPEPEQAQQWSEAA